MLLEQLASETETAREAALVKYKEIIRRAANPADGDASALRDCMREIGIDQQQVQQDVDAVQAVAQLESECFSETELVVLGARSASAKATAIEDARKTLHAMIDATTEDRIFPILQQVGSMVGDASGKPLRTLESAGAEAYHRFALADRAVDEARRTSSQSRVRIHHLKSARPLAF
jgi:hypothetical protein